MKKLGKLCYFKLAKNITKLSLSSKKNDELLKLRKKLMKASLYSKSKSFNFLWG